MSESSEPRADKPPTDADRPTAGHTADNAPNNTAEQLELKLPDESSSPRDLALWAGVLALLTLIAYWPATNGDFLWRDDRAATSPRFVGTGALGRNWFDRWDTPQSFPLPAYQPVALTAYWLEYQLGGHTPEGVPAPMAYHIASLIFLAGSAILLWLALRELKIPGAWLIAAIFALHPVHAEPVSWISEQPITLAGLLFFGSIYLYLLFIGFLDADRSERAAGKAGIDPAQTWGLLAGSALLCLLAILSHPAAVVLPLVILLILRWRKRVTTIDTWVLVALFAAGAILWLLNSKLPRATDSTNLLQASIATQISVVGRAMGFSAASLIFPVHLSIFYSSSGLALGLILAALVAGVLFGSYLMEPVVGPGPFTGLAIYALLAGASVNWFDPSRLSSIIDPTAYLAIAPLISLAVIWAAQTIQRAKFQGPQLAVGCSAVLLIALAIPAWLAAHTFENPIALWRDTLKSHPDSVLAEASLAEQLRLQGMEDTSEGNRDAMDADFAEALDHAGTALRLNPGNASAQQTWANILVDKGDDAGALPHFQAALQSDPANAPTRNAYASALMALGRFRPAIEQLDESLAQDPASLLTHRMLGKAYFGIGDFARTIREEQLALSTNPTDNVARELLGDAQAQLGQLNEARDSYVMVLTDPAQRQRADLWSKIARLKDRQGDYDLAVQYLQAAQKLAPDDQEINKSLTAEQEKQRRAAATRPSSRSATEPATTQATP